MRYVHILIALVLFPSLLFAGQGMYPVPMVYTDGGGTPPVGDGCGTNGLIHSNHFEDDQGINPDIILGNPPGCFDTGEDQYAILLSGSAITTPTDAVDGFDPIDGTGVYGPGDTTYNGIKYDTAVTTLQSEGRATGYIYIPNSINDEPIFSINAIGDTDHLALDIVNVSGNIKLMLTYKGDGTSKTAELLTTFSTADSWYYFDAAWKQGATNDASLKFCNEDQSSCVGPTEYSKSLTAPSANTTVFMWGNNGKTGQTSSKDNCKLYKESGL